MHSLLMPDLANDQNHLEPLENHVVIPSFHFLNLHLVDGVETWGQGISTS